jgi:hypothetical protein
LQVADVVLSNHFLKNCLLRFFFADVVLFNNLLIDYYYIVFLFFELLVGKIDPSAKPLVAGVLVFGSPLENLNAFKLNIAVSWTFEPFF